MSLALGSNPDVSPTLSAVAYGSGRHSGHRGLHESRAGARSGCGQADRHLGVRGRVFEMLTGGRPFAGEDVTETLAFVITREPDWTNLPAGTPAAVRRLLQRALEQDQRRRLADVADARIELEMRDVPRRTSSSSIHRRRLQARERLVWIVAVSALALVSLIAGVRALRPRTAPPETRVDIAAPETNLRDLVCGVAGWSQDRLSCRG